MKREDLKEILKDLNPTDEHITRIMALNGNDVNALNTELSTLKTQLSDRAKDIEELKKSDKSGELKTQLEAMERKYAEAQNIIDKRNYSDAVRTAIAEKGIKFTSKSAENYYMSQAESKKMDIKDGKLIGFEDFHKAQFEADKGAFACEDKTPDMPSPAPSAMRFAGTAGSGGNSAVSAAALAAQRFNRTYNPTAENNTNMKGD